MSTQATDHLCLWFTPEAIREHFAGLEPDRTQGLTDEQLIEVGQYALDHDALYETFHDVLLDAFRERVTPDQIVLGVAEKLASVYGGMQIDADHNGPPMDTTNYDGRAWTFFTTVDGVQIRVLVEDVTPDSERSYIYRGME